MASYLQSLPVLRHYSPKQLSEGLGCGDSWLDHHTLRATRRPMRSGRPNLKAQTRDVQLSLMSKVAWAREVRW